jgi:hypothetical protein
VTPAAKGSIKRERRVDIFGFAVPFKVDLGVGNNWRVAHP